MPSLIRWKSSVTCPHCGAKIQLSRAPQERPGSPLVACTPIGSANHGHWPGRERQGRSWAIDPVVGQLWQYRGRDADRAPKLYEVTAVAGELGGLSVEFRKVKAPGALPLYVERRELTFPKWRLPGWREAVAFRAAAPDDEIHIITIMNDDGTPSHDVSATWQQRARIAKIPQPVIQSVTLSGTALDDWELWWKPSTGSGTVIRRLDPEKRVKGMILLGLLPQIRNADCVLALARSAMGVTR